MKILALEFSSPQRSVAVAIGFAGGAPSGVSEVVESGPGAARGLAMVDEALRAAKLEREEIECLAVGLGPGSYTGIRAAIALAQGWQLARGVNLIGISSAECVAAGAHAAGLSGRVGIVIDAQRDELYLAAYELDPSAWREIAPLRIVSLPEARERERSGEIMAGPEANRWFPQGRMVHPRAQTLAKLAARRGTFVAGQKLEPVYLRPTSFVKAPPRRSWPDK